MLCNGKVEYVKEFGCTGYLFQHDKTGSELMSMVQPADENKTSYAEHSSFFSSSLTFRLSWRITIRALNADIDALRESS